MKWSSKDTDEATNDAVMAKIQELSTQWTEVVWFKDIVNFHNDQQQKSIDSQDANVFSEDYNIRKNDIWEWTLLWVWVAWLGWVWLRQGSKLLKSRYTQWRGVDTAKYLIRNLVNPTNSLSINFVEDEAINLMDYLGGLTPEEIKMIQREPMGNFRWLIKKIVADRNTVINARNAILQNNATKQVWYEILQPLADEINRLGIWGELGWKKQDLIELYDEVKWMLDKNGGSMSVADAEILKETAYESYDYSKLSKNAVDAKTMNRWLGSKLLWQWTKLWIEGAVWDPKLAQLNEQYGIIRTIEKNLWGNVTKISKMPRYTTIGMVRKELWEIVQSIPWVSALGNLQWDLPDIVIEEKNYQR